MLIAYTKDTKVKKDKFEMGGSRFLEFDPYLGQHFDLLTFLRHCCDIVQSLYADFARIVRLLWSKI